MGVFWASEDHCENNFSDPNNWKFSHTGNDGSMPDQRVSRYGTYKRTAENMAWGPTDAEEALVMLLIDDGIESRGHRNNIFGNYTHAGVAFCDSVSVWNFAKKFRFNAETKERDDKGWKPDCSAAASRSSRSGEASDDTLRKSAGSSLKNAEDGR